MVKFLSDIKTIKENIIDSILDKIVVNSISQKDIDMLNLVNNKEITEWHLISINTLVGIINNLLSDGERILCKLTDSQGEINLFISKVESSGEHHYLNFRRETYKLKDNYLYNVKFDVENNYWILEFSQVYEEEIHI